MQQCGDTLLLRVSADLARAQLLLLLLYLEPQGLTWGGGSSSSGHLVPPGKETQGSKQWWAEGVAQPPPSEGAASYQPWELPGRAVPLCTLR